MRIIVIVIFILSLNFSSAQAEKFDEKFVVNIERFLESITSRKFDKCLSSGGIILRDALDLRDPIIEAVNICYKNEESVLFYGCYAADLTVNQGRVVNIIDRLQADGYLSSRGTWQKWEIFSTWREGRRRLNLYSGGQLCGLLHGKLWPEIKINKIVTIGHDKYRIYYGLSYRGADEFYESIKSRPNGQYNLDVELIDRDKISQHFVIRLQTQS